MFDRDAVGRTLRAASSPGAGQDVVDEADHLVGGELHGVLVDAVETALRRML
ncbi:hypothetical protein AB0C27_22130 [Nonomuraea sp. NPDC048882]|uniref:hypothetical protein n=1 Tax=unclassified Nonomuraea TaxID=2593643 RepID=UPI0033F16048